MRLIIPILLLCFFTSCQRGTQKADDRQAKTFEAAKSNFFNNLVKPADLASELKAAAPDFHPEFMSDPKMYSHYTSNEVKASANLGIYVADLNYAIAYAQTDLSKEYFEAAYELSRAAGIEKSVLEFLSARYHENLSKNDSVRSVVNDLLAKSTRGLQGTQRERLAGIAMAAYQIENLHLALAIQQLPSEKKGDLPLRVANMIMSQRQNVETIYNFLRIYSDPLNANSNPNYPYYANALLELLDTYKAIESGAQNDPRRALNQKVDAIRSMIVAIGR